MKTSIIDPERYRPNVGLALFSKAGHVFVGRRINGRGAFQWQMPQGGVDKGESTRDGALRELEEEIGVPEKLVDVLEETEDWLYYDFPPDLKKRLPGPYIGCAVQASRLFGSGRAVQSLGRTCAWRQDRPGLRER